MFVEEKRTLSRTSLRKRLRAGLFIDEVDLDVHVDLLSSEVGRRQRQAETTYPFAWKESGLSRAPVSDEAPYEFLLWLATSPHYREQRRFSEIELLFDNLVKQALILYLVLQSRLPLIG